MKKLMTVCFVGLLLILLTACNQTAKPTESTEEVDAETIDVEEEEVEQDSELTLEQLFEKSTEANKDLKSFSLNMDLQQKMDFGGETMDMNSNILMDVTTDPYNIKQNMVMDLGEMGSQEMEMYLVDDSLYLFEPTEEEWMKFPSELSEELMQLSDADTDLSSQLEQFEDFMDDFTFEEDNGNYVLTLNATGDKFNDLLNETIENSMPEELGLDGEIFDNMKFDNVEYEIVIDGDTFYYSKLNVIMDYEMEIEGEKIKVHQDIQSDYSNHNGIDEITIPQEAIDNAVEMEL